MTDIVMRRYQKGDEEGLELLCKDVYGISTNNDYWRWKYETFWDFNASYVAVYEGKIVGMAGAVPYMIKAMDKEIVGGQLTDLMSDPQYRGKKDIFLPIMRKSIKAVETQMDIMYGFTNDNSFKIFAKRLKYDIAFRVPRLDRIINISPFLRRRLKNDGFLIKVISGAINTMSKNLFYSRMPLLEKEVKIREVHEFDERFDRLWHKLKGLFPIATIRDSKYLNWRYCNHPLYKYKTFIAEKGDVVYGFIILKCVEDKDLKRGYIVDLWIEPGRRDLLTALVAMATRFFKDERADLMTCWMFPHIPYYSLLRKNLFFKRTSNLVMLTTSFHEGISGDFLKNPANWYVTMGDCDSF